MEDKIQAAEINKVVYVDMLENVDGFSLDEVYESLRRDMHRQYPKATLVSVDLTLRAHFPLRED